MILSLLDFSVVLILLLCTLLFALLIQLLLLKYHKVLLLCGIIESFVFLFIALPKLNFKLPHRLDQVLRLITHPQNRQHRSQLRKYNRALTTSGTDLVQILFEGLLLRKIETCLLHQFLVLALRLIVQKEVMLLLHQTFLHLLGLDVILLL